MVGGEASVLACLGGGAAPGRVGGGGVPVDLGVADESGDVVEGCGVSPSLPSFDFPTGPSDSPAPTGERGGR